MLRIEDSQHLNRTALLTRVISAVIGLLLIQAPIWAQDGTLKWDFDAGQIIESSPAIGPEGITYVGSVNDQLFAVQPDGTQQWSFDTGDSIRQASVVAESGVIYVGNDNGVIFALNPDGTQMWTFDSGLESRLTGEMALAADGTLYAGIGTATEATVFAINPDGSQAWTFDPGSTIRGISIGNGGAVVLTDGTGDVYSLTSQGDLMWNVDFTNGINAPASIADDGTIYVASNSEFMALDPEDGSQIWEIATEGSSESAATAVDGTIYLPVAESASAGALLALDPEDGSQIWSFGTTARVQTTPAVGFDGIIYIGTDSETVIAVRPDGTQLWVFEAEGDVQSSATIAEDGTVIFGSNDGMLYGVRSSSAGLAASSWPKKQRDVRNTGRFGSDVTRRRWFAPQVYWLDEENNSVITVTHIGGSAGNPVGTTASFRIDVLNADGSLRFSREESVEPGETADIVLTPPDENPFAGAAVIDAAISDGSFLAPFLTWRFDISDRLEPLGIGAFFSDPTDAALVHHFPGRASSNVGLGVGVQNIGNNEIGCSLEFTNSNGTMAAEEDFELQPLGSLVGFFNDSLPGDFSGKGTLSCDAPVVVIAVNQDFANGGFPTDRVTIKQRN
ncbi:MAG TPA: PQQ-binding-like beta-propeller repeat protein [Acidobacteriota bacterium]|nr:PQQ-binding-like beta-propeller repeat protein [Acidobacteriota bacterium]